MIRPSETEAILKRAGISAGIITAIVVVAGAFIIYRTSREVKLLNLQIDKLEREKNDL